MNKNSLTITGLIIALISFLCLQLGIPLTEELIGDLITSIAKVIFILGQIVGIVQAWIGRHRRGDINWLGVKKT